MAAAGDGGREVRGKDARRVAIDALVRVDTEGAYANVLLPTVLPGSGLSPSDRAFVTHLVYGTTRMRRACDFLVDRFLLRDVDPPTRAALRCGAYQLAFLDTPPHAAVGETVAAVPKRTRGFVNAVLRKVSADIHARPADGPGLWPDDATRLSYPDWVVRRLTDDLGRDAALAALEAMNEPAEVTEREDGYVQDRGSQLVVEAVGAGPGETVVDVCAAPGGKATALAGTGARVVALDRRTGRMGLVAANVERLGLAGAVTMAVADGRAVPLRPGCADRVLVDAPCSGLGSLRRRPDARWRVDDGAPERLAALQVDLLAEAVSLLRPGGELVYAVCTLTVAETTGVADALAGRRPDLLPLDPPGAPWRPWGSGALLLPQAEGTDGMAVFRWRRPA